MTKKFKILSQENLARTAATQPFFVFLSIIQNFSLRKRNHKIYNFEAYYARLNLKRGRGRTLLTILSLVMSITVFVALQSFTGLLDASSSIQDMYFSDYAVTNETSGIPAEAISTLEVNDTVKDISTVRLSVFTPGAGDELPFETDLSVQSHETFQLVNIDDGLLEIYAPNLSDQDKQALNNGTGCLVKNPIPFSYGDTPVEHLTEVPDSLGKGAMPM